MVIQVRKIFKCHSSFPSQYFRNQWICRSLPHYCFSFLAEQEEQGVSTSVSTTARLFFSKVKCQHKDFCDTRTSSTIFMIHEVFLGPQNPNQFPNVPWVLAAWGHDCFPGETVPCPGKAPCLNTQPDHPFHGSTPLPRVLLLVTR